MADVVEGLKAWLADQWNPDLTVAEWWGRPGLAGDRVALDAATGKPMHRFVTEMALFAQAPPIDGGTDRAQRNTPFSELPKNA